MRISKKLAAVLLVVAVTFGTMPFTAFAEDFDFSDDIIIDIPYEAAPLDTVLLYNKSYTSGYADGTFRPNEFLTIGELAEIFDNLYHDADYPDKDFNPDMNITRAEAATAIVLFKELSGSGEASFTDIQDHWAKSSIEILYAAGYINGYTDGTFKPDQNITRAEMVYLINAVEGRLNAFDTDNTFSDLTEDYWAYEAIMNAVNGYNIFPPIYETMIF